MLNSTFILLIETVVGSFRTAFRSKDRLKTAGTIVPHLKHRLKPCADNPPAPNRLPPPLTAIL
ncbi:hypothetical protein E0W53_07250 [Neisseria meningitidis]|nr:hypothetical protein [Neisseria meningitidis]MBG8720329.1 hypothetical protein [Neisseria meningitidis]MBJ7836944.1 hypothetical protein [Neisseria meningitidis]